MSGSSLNLKQVIGGTAIKQGDTNTRLGYELLDKSSGPMYSDIMSEIDNVSIKVILTELKAKTSIVITDATIKNGTVIFTMPAETTPGRYDVEIAVSVKGQTAVFPSTYASVTLEIVKSYFMARPDDSDVKYINLGTLPTSDDISKIQTQLDKLQEEIKNVGAGGSEDISRIDAELKALQTTVTGLPTVDDVEAKASKEDLANKLDVASLEPINASISKLEKDISIKASTESVTALESKITELPTKEAVDDSIHTLKEDIETKATKEELRVQSEEIKDAQSKIEANALNVSKTSESFQNISKEIDDIKARLETTTGGMSEEEKQELNTKLESLESRIGTVKNKNPNGKDISMWLGTEEELSALKEEDLNDNSTIYIRS